MFIELIRKRRSIRQFEKKMIEKEKIELLKEAALRAPSSRNLNPWEFIFITDQELLKKMAEAKKHGSEFLAECGLAVVVLADPAKCDVWIEDASIASIYLILQAHDIGLGACWVQIRERNKTENQTSEDYIKKLLLIPKNLKIESVIGIGYPGETREPLSFNCLEFKKIKDQSYQ